jgi:hypothetical protein
MPVLANTCQISNRYVSIQTIIDIELYDMVADPLFFTANGKATVINRFGINFSQKKVKLYKLSMPVLANTCQISNRYVSTQSIIDIELYDMVANPLFFTANGKDTKINILLFFTNEILFTIQCLVFSDSTVVRQFHYTVGFWCQAIH